MAIYAGEPEGGSSNIPVIEPGTYPGRCYLIADLGTHTEEFLGVKKTARRVIISFELPTEMAVFKEGEEAKPRVISKEYALFMNEQSNLYKLIVSWFGIKPTEEQKRKFDVTQFIGLAGMVTITHTENGKAKITNISKLMKGLTIDAPILEPVVFSLADFDEKTFDSLPKFIKTKIEASPEYQKLKAPKAAPKSQLPNQKATIPEPVPIGADDESDLPDFLRSR
jgi:hypothetical protein